MTRIILIINCTKSLEKLAQHCNIVMTSYLKSSQMPFTDKDGF